MEPSDERRFHLMIVHGVGDSEAARDAANKFWSTRFPRAFVTKFPFLADDANWGYSGLLERAVSLLAAAETAQKHLDEQDEHLPWVFLCHDLGGSIVKQALVLASEDRRYSWVSRNTALLVLCNTPNVSDDSKSYDQAVIGVLDGADTGSLTYSRLVSELSNALQHIHWTFSIVRRHHTIIDVQSCELENTSFKIIRMTGSASLNVEDSAEPHANIESEWEEGKTAGTYKSSYNVRLRFRPRAHVRLISANTRRELWRFAPGESHTECVFDLIDHAVKKELQTGSEELRAFISLLSGFDENDHQIRLSPSFPGSLDWITTHASYKVWETLKPSAPNILYLHGPRASGGGVTASHILTSIAATTPIGILLTYSFDQRSPRTQPITTFYVSLIRQLLLCQPSLFRRVSNISSWIKNEDISGSEILRSLLLSLLKGAYPSPVYCVIYGAQECQSFSLDKVISLLRDYRRLSSGLFKFVIIGESPAYGQFQHVADLCRDIDLSETPHDGAPISKHAQSKVDKLIANHPHFRFLKNNLLKRLNDHSSFLRTDVYINLIGYAQMSTTRSAVADYIDALPSTLEELYYAALADFQKRSPLSIVASLPWITHTVRPLSMREFAVVTTLMTFEKICMDCIKENLPTCIAKDLQPINGTLIKIISSRVLPIHGTVTSVLARSERLSEDDPHTTILSICLDYLESAIQHLNLGENLPLDLKTSMIDDDEFALLTYVVTSWPRHYLKVRNTTRIIDRVLKMFTDRRNIETWSALYQRYGGVMTKYYSELDHILKISSRFGMLDLASEAITQTKLEENSKDILSDSLDLAAGHGNDTVVGLLLDNGAKSDRAACLAADGGFLAIFQALTKAHPNLFEGKDQFHTPPFVLAALNGQRDVVAYLLSKGVSHDTTVGSNFTALHVAAMTGQTEIFESLINAGSDIKAATDDNDDALKMAAAGGFDDVVTIALTPKYGVDVNGQTNDGNTALHNAVLHGHLSTCNILFEHNANVQVENKGYLLPVNIAAREGYLEILQQLIARMPDSEAPVSSEGNEIDGDILSPLEFDTTAAVLSPLHLAASHGHIKIVHELLKHQRYNSDKGRSIAMMLAAAEGHADVVDQLLRSGVSYMVQDENGNTALHLATQRQYPDIVSQLLEAKLPRTATFSIDSSNNTGWTPLLLAARSGRLLTVRVLLHHKAQLDYVNNDGQTALHVAARFGHSYIVAELLRHADSGGSRHGEADIRLCEDNFGNTPFILAVQGSHLDIARELVPGPSSSLNAVDLQGSKNALAVAAESSAQDFIPFLLECGWDIAYQEEKDNTGVLHYAAGAGDASMIRLLAQLGADPNATKKDGTTPLHKAVASNPDAVLALLEKGGKINAEDGEGITPLWRAAYRGETDCVKELLRWNPDLNTAKRSTGWTALHAAYDNPEITRLLLDAHADPTTLTTEGDPPMFLAADHWRGDQTIRHYLEAGVSPNVRNRAGLTCMHVAAREGRLRIVEVLLDYGGDATAITDTGVAPIHYAADERNADIVGLLLEKGADAEAQCTQYGTPLMAAASSACSPAVDSLLRYNANPNRTSKNARHTALQAAARSGSDVIVTTLLSAGADVNLTGGMYGSALCAAIANRNTETARLLLGAGTDINHAAGPEGAALEIALGLQDSALIDLCFEQVPDVNIISKGRFGTALIAAIEMGDSLNVKRLLDVKADPNLRGKTSESPAQVAVRKGRQNIVELLVKHGASLDYKDDSGRGPLSHAISWKSIDLLPFLWEQNIDINEQDLLGRTALIISAILGTDIFSDLITHDAKLDIQDKWGKTALIHAVSRGYSTIVATLLDAGADPLIKDSRGRDVLYWAALGSSVNTFERVMEVMQKVCASPSRYQHAVNGAITSNNFHFADSLLGNIQYSNRQADEDGWTAHYTALRYFSPVKSLIYKASRNAGLSRGDSTNLPKLPREWHELDMSTGLFRQENPMVVEVKKFNSFELHGTARADHPMFPMKDGVYYFEVKIEKQGGDEIPVGVGFCEENVPLGYMLGWRDKAWGYHGDDGDIFADGQNFGDPFGPKFGDGDTIGCGVNFGEEIAFYTKNGDIIGCAFHNIRGKLYPAISANIELAGCTITARFPQDRENIHEGFSFKGSLTDPKSLEVSERAQKEAKRRRSSSVSSLGSLPRSFTQSSTSS